MPGLIAGDGMRGVRTAIVVAAALFGMLVSAPTTAAAQTTGRFDGWAAVIISADWRDHADQPIAAFDNARRDLTQGFISAGFAPEAIYEASLRPDAPHPVSAAAAVAAATALTARQDRGCLVYFTSHGGPDGMVFGADRTLDPTDMARLLRGICGARPTVLVVSACFSGIFVDGLAGPNRMILTAARRDRSSFGCGADAKYPYFDGCIIESLPTATDFIALAQAARTCVGRRETEEHLIPPSEPQLSIGANMQLLLPTLRFTHPETAASSP